MDNRKVLDDFEKHWGIYRAPSRPPLKLIWKKRGASSTLSSVLNWHGKVRRPLPENSVLQSAIPLKPV